jgi:sigma-B regulation protein RsbU (phosphoserine phosphatase)
MDIKSIIQKLSFQIGSSQEGFEILSHSNNLEELVKNFAHIIRGNLLVTNLQVYHSRGTDGWRNLCDKQEKPNELLKTKSPSDPFKIEYPEEPEVSVKASLPLYDKSAFYIIVGKKLSREGFTDLDKIAFQIFIQLLTNAYHSLQTRKKEKELIFELNNRVLQLNSLIDTGIEVTKFEKRQILLELAIERAASTTSASMGMVRRYEDSEVKETIVFPSLIKPEDLAGSEYKIAAEFEHFESRYEFLLFNKETRRGYSAFDSTDSLLLEAIARQVQAAIENAFYHQQSLEAERIQQELNLASTIQKQIIPDKLPEIDGYAIAGINIPSKEVGGDYYDCVKLENGKYALIIADVTGKGVPASLLVSTLNASLMSYLDIDIPLPDLAVKLNTLVYKSSPLDTFITFFIALLDPESGELDIINAGHNSALLLRSDGKLEKFDAGGVALGMFDMGLPFEGQKTTIGKGERLLLFTDGIPEAMNVDDEEYSDERLDDFFINNLPDDPSNFIKSIVRDVKNFTGSAPQSDDITAIYLIRRNG